MESPVAHKLLKQIAAFSTDVDNLAREVHTLRKTGNPQHLPTIKDVTQRLITQLLAFSAQLAGAKGAMPQHQVRSRSQKQYTKTLTLAARCSFDSRFRVQ